MDYKQTVEYIDELKKYGSVPGLDSIARLCKRLGNPQDDLKIIHIAGTNGKGSTGAFIAQTLITAGCSVCRFVSPAVGEYEEILTFNNENISKMELAEIFTLLKAENDKIVSDGFPHPTLFETETAAAFLYCKKKSCDFAVLETGMGGAEDSVNVINHSLISVITSIGMDHMSFLGNTIEEIAYQKAGIIKQNGTVISAVQADEVRNVLTKVCREKSASLTFADKISNIRGMEFDYDGIKNIKSSLDGTFQLENAALAVEVCRALKISDDCIRRGISSTVWHYRFEEVCKNPVFILDGAHNTAAAVRLMETIKLKFGAANEKTSKINLIIGIFADKEYEKIAEITAGYADRIFCITPDNPRGLNNERLKEQLERYNDNVFAKTLDEAARLCLDDTDSATIAFGSLSYLGRLKNILAADRR